MTYQPPKLWPPPKPERPEHDLAWLFVGILLINLALVALAYITR